ncbi:PREDICTED: pentatricopeptide repeat-containing protein At1g60770 [Tarenaya hassleriana]|uniref:pentatricopeptide repeat-containing protein At1g60770 n=1 Tax=Tarenaya hassleriana TaxID=28532 RepID=UPI00053C302C|nr:PREDICTED: pentatricopeptide repeat-containing protein At1g60770 [Tarenaya hassleriana]
MAMRQLSRTKNVAKRSTKKYLEEPLYHRLFKDGSSEVSVRQQLNQFLKSSKSVFKWEVGDTIKKLRSHRLYYPALKLSEAMEDRCMNKTVSDQAIHLDLVAKARGIAAAENYFVDLPETSKTHLTYGSLLNCYCKELMTDKAEGLLDKMKELNFTLTSMSYNSLMTLYTKTGQSEKVPAIIQEMKAENIMPDSYTYNVWMRALAATKDISGVERVSEEMNRDGRVAPDWTTYSNLATIYVDAGLSEKAEKALQELERKNDHGDFLAYQFLITLYGRLGKVTEVYRVWRSLRLAFPKTTNVAYLNTIQVLVNLKDLPGAETLFKEWQSNCSIYDIRVVNVLIGAYARDGLVVKAKEMKDKAHRRGAKANAKTWEIFMDYYMKNGEIAQAVECISKAVSIGRGDGSKWLPSQETIGTLMGHFEQEKDVDGAESFVEILKKGTDNVGVEVLESLIRTYAAAGKKSTAMRRRLKMENVEVSEATKKLLDEICEE